MSLAFYKLRFQNNISYPAFTLEIYENFLLYFTSLKLSILKYYATAHNTHGVIIY